jgi:hypothetical protein
VTPEECSRIHERHVALTTAPQYLALIERREALRARIRVLAFPTEAMAFIDAAAIATLEAELAKVRTAIDLYLNQPQVTA